MIFWMKCNHLDWYLSFTIRLNVWTEQFSMMSITTISTHLSLEITTPTKSASLAPLFMGPEYYHLPKMQMELVIFMSMAILIPLCRSMGRCFNHKVDDHNNSISRHREWTSARFVSISTDKSCNFRMSPDNLWQSSVQTQLPTFISQNASRECDAVRKSRWLQQWMFRGFSSHNSGSAS
jgi:hypothetical protein